MRKLLHSTVALSALLATSMTANAADAYARPSSPPPYSSPPYVPPVYAPPPFSWTGFYVGGNIGGAWANRDVTDTFLGVNFNNGNSNGVFIGGAQLGYNWQVGYAVLGIEADFDGAANNNNTLTVGARQVTLNNRWITTLAARFGLTNGPWLFYGKVRRLGRQRRLYRRQPDDRFIDHRLQQQQQQRLAGGRGHRVGFRPQ